LDGSIACGSSMMPQKKNPDVFELLRGKSAGAVGDLMALITLLKGMPTGYMRDRQEDKLPLFSADERLALCLKTLGTGLAGIRLRPERTLPGVKEGFTQATDLAERLVARGVPFRDAYKAVGALVRLCVDASRPLASITLEEARQHHGSFEADDLRALDPAVAADAKGSAGGTGSGPLEAQLRQLRQAAEAGAAFAQRVPTVDRLLATLASAPLQGRA
ncbi:MAG: lyase family protein, partial [Myxococcales bacterium]